MIRTFERLNPLIMFRAPEGGGGGGGSEETEDRGDDFTPTIEDGSIELTGENDPELLAAIAGKDEGEGDEGDPDKGGEGEPDMIPKARFDEVNGKYKTVAEENEALKAKLAEKDKPAGEEHEEEGEPDKGTDPIAELRAQLKEKRAAARDALLDGEMETHDALSDEIDEINRRIAREEWNREQEQRSAQERTAQSLKDVAAEAFEKYPFLDSGKDGFDEDAINAVVARRAALEKEGKSPAEALKQAVEEKGPRFAKLNGIDLDTDKGEAERKERERKHREKNAAASGQPPFVAGSEKETFKVDPMKLSDEEYAKLPESVKAAARGDSL